MSNPETLNYREWYQRERKSRFYLPLFHVGFNFLALIFLNLFHFLSIEKWRFPFLFLFFLMMIFGNLTVWIIHRYPLHRRYKSWSYPFVVHSQMHHRYFSSDQMTYDSIEDYVAIFFPMSVILFFTIFAQPLIYFGALQFLGQDFAHFISGLAAFYFLLYESFHWGSHLPENHFLMKFSWLNYMRNHHRIHHHPPLMHLYNFCIVFPLMDFIFGTKFRGELKDSE